MMMTAMQTILDMKTAQKAAQSPVLDIDFHLPILRRWPVGMAERANVAEHFLFTSCRDYVSKGAAEYMRKQKDLMQQQQGGFVLTRDLQHSALDRCASLVAASFRQMRTGRVILLQDLLKRLKSDEVPDIAMIAVPDFFDDSVALTGYSRQLVMHFLSNQYLNSKATVLYVSSMKEMRKVYGEQVFDHINQNYFIE
jgi:hypothetical protein